ncbi:Ig-like domain-containing protein, partial [Vibrio sp. RW]
MDVTVLNLVSVLALGQRIVISLDGTIRVLQDGESLQPGDVILESPNESQVSVKRFSPEDGSEVELEQDIANIFAALEEGQDPTELGEEFATEAGQSGSSISISATIERDGQETTPGTEFVTTGFEALGMSRTQSLSLLDAFRSIEQRLGTDNETIGDTTAPDAPTLTLDTDSGSAADDFLTNDGSFTVGGTEEGATVEYLVDGNWTTTAPVPTEGDNTITVRQTDAAGNTSGSSELTFTLDTRADAGTVNVDEITSDDVITVTEQGKIIAVTGSAVGGDIQSEDTVTAEINGSIYTTTVGDNGSWQLNVSGEDLAADTAFDVYVSSEDAAGNSVESKGSSTHTFDQTSVNVNIDIDPITDDSVINAKEVADTVTITGSVTGETYESAIVTLTVGGVEYAGTVTDGKYSIDVNGSDLQFDSDSVVDAKVDVVNAAGNIGSATSTEFYLVDTFARGTISIDSITDDNVINKSESESIVILTGSVGGDARPGDQVSVVVNGVTYLTTVLSNKSWSLDVKGSDLAADSSVTATVTGNDWAGNGFSGSAFKGYEVSSDLPTIDLTTVGDGNISVDEADEVTLSGTTTNVEENQTVTLTVTDSQGNTAEFEATVKADGTFSVDADLSATDLVDGNITVKADVTDTEGNPASDTDSAKLDTT